MAENRDDQPLSSEELLRRAREGLGGSEFTDSAPPDFAIESFPPPAEDDETEPVTPVEEPAAPRFEEPTFTEPPPPASETRDEPASWAPPPMPCGWH